MISVLPAVAICFAVLALGFRVARRQKGAFVCAACALVCAVSVLAYWAGDVVRLVVDVWTESAP